MRRQVNLSTSFLIALGLLLAAASPGRARPAPPTGASCSACIVVDDAGKALWSRAPGEALPNASTTKIATALVVVRAADLDEQVTVSEGAAAAGGGGLDLVAGDVYSVGDLLHALLMTSSNDAAAALAEHVSGTQDAFVAEMNDLLDELGARDTTFLTPHGLDTPGHAASARDLALLGARLLEHPVLAATVATEETTVEGSPGPQELVNTNLLLDAYEGAVGIKTGETALAGQVLVGAAERRGELVVAVAMHSSDAASDVAALLDYGFAEVARAERDDHVSAQAVERAAAALDAAFDSLFARLLTGDAGAG